MSEELVVMIKCPKCGQEKVADTRNKHMCVDCAKAESKRYTHLRMNQGDWIEAAKDAGIDPWLQQPGETQWEYTIWCTYRDAYPGKKPKYGDVAEQLCTTHDVVRKVAQRWTFQARLQLWMTECDRITMLQRHKEILDMNADHISMAQRLRDKLSVAIDMIDPRELKPSDISSLFKMSADLERRARVDDIAQDEMRRDMLRDTDNPNVKKSPTKQNDLAEVAQILLNAGALGSNVQIGIRETREVVVKESD